MGRHEAQGGGDQGGRRRRPGREAEARDEEEESEGRDAGMSEGHGLMSGREAETYDAVMRFEKVIVAV